MNFVATNLSQRGVAVGQLPARDWIKSSWLDGWFHPTQILGSSDTADDFPVRPIDNVWAEIMGVQSRADPKIYVVQTATNVIERCILMTTDPGDLVLDPTCGSGTTAYVAEQWGRRWITCDTSRVALALARTRLMAAKYPYYLLADSPEGIKKEAELTGKTPSAAHNR